jgi:hypothetical protein
MNPHTDPQIELVLAVESAEHRALALMQGAGKHHKALTADQLHDHRCAAAGDVCDAIDRIKPGLGMRLMQAIFPEVDVATEQDMGELQRIGSIYGETAL